MQEKSHEPFYDCNENKSSKKFRFWDFSIIGTVLSFLAIVYFLNQRYLLIPQTITSQCPTVEKLVPGYDAELSNLDQFHSNVYSNYSLKVWSDAVRIPTLNWDDLGKVGDDSRWEIFEDFANYLVKTFAAVTSNSKLEKVNTYGLVFTIEGSNKSLKPILLAGHQDVVPVPDETADRWTYPPFEGHFDGKFLWGRGSSDCKNNVIGIFEALDELLKRGFKPKRTIIVALGFDEETSGNQGATAINEYLIEKYGEKSIFMIVDEGGLGIQDIYGSRFALPSTGEKGYIDVVIDLITTGGHSSVPPRHTGIGIIAELVKEIEDKEYDLDLTPKNPYFYQLQCEAEFARAMDKNFKKDILKLSSNAAAKKRVLDTLRADDTTKALISTTQAIDIIFGGLKINALPEKVTVKINHRVGYDSSIEDVRLKITKAVAKVAKKFSLNANVFGKRIVTHSENEAYFNVTEDSPLSPAPLTIPYGNPTWDILGGTIKHVFEDFASFEGYDPSVSRDVIVAPSCMTGNTDTRHYWNLSDNIYRFTPIRQDMRLNAHAIDERVALDAHIEGVVFYYELIRNADAFSE